MARILAGFEKLTEIDIKVSHLKPSNDTGNRFIDFGFSVTKSNRQGTARRYANELDDSRREVQSEEWKDDHDEDEWLMTTGLNVLQQPWGNHQAILDFRPHCFDLVP